MNRKDVLAALHEFKRERGKEYGISQIGVFGSFARDEARDDSDVDVVFETNDPNLFRTASIKQDLQARLGRHVDIVRLRRTMNPRLRERIVREALYA